MSDRVRVMRHGRVVQFPTHAPTVVEVGVRGIPGGRGPKGEKGDALKFEDLTDEQKAELKGPKGDKGEDGSSFIVAIDAAVIDKLF